VFLKQNTMKNPIKYSILLAVALLLLSCKGGGKTDDGNTGQSTDAAAGQHIGANTDSTTVDGKSGSMSNN